MHILCLNLDRISPCYLLILLNDLRKAVIATKIVLFTIFLGSVLLDTIASIGKQKFTSINGRKSAEQINKSLSQIP